MSTQSLVLIAVSGFVVGIGGMVLIATLLGPKAAPQARDNAPWVHCIKE